MARQTLAVVVLSSLAAAAVAAPDGSLRGAAAGQAAKGGAAAAVAVAHGNASRLQAASRCSRSWGACLSSKCCGAGCTCYEKDTTYAQCQPTGQCKPGIHENDPVPTYWSCKALSAGPPDAPPGCSASWGSCQLTKCCGAGYTCYQKDRTYAQCQPSGQCVPGEHADDPVPGPWSCHVLSPTPAPAPRPVPSPVTTTAPLACRDSDPSCPGWARLSQCEKNPEYMLAYCPLSCGVCI